MSLVDKRPLGLQVKAQTWSAKWLAWVAALPRTRIEMSCTGFLSR